MTAGAQSQTRGEEDEMRRLVLGAAAIALCLAGCGDATYGAGNEVAVAFPADVDPESGPLEPVLVPALPKAAPSANAPFVDR